MGKKGLKTDLKKLKKFCQISNHISGFSSGDNESEIQKHCFIFRLPRDLHSGTYALGNSILLFTVFLSMFECKDQKISALVISFIPFKNFAEAPVGGCRACFFRHVVGLPTFYLRHARDRVLLFPKPSTVCSHQCRKNRSLSESSHLTL